MKYRIPAALVFASFLLLSVRTVRADSTPLLAYTLTGPVNASFELPVNFTVDADSYDLGVGFYVTPLDLTINGSLASGDFLIFYSSTMDGAFGDWDGLFSLTGPQLYSGPESAPSMSDIPGNIALADFFTGAGGYTLTVTPVSTPEPATIVLMGSGLLSLFLKRRPKVTG
jgi:PEP-CTERM motif-containing protein